MIKSFDNNSLRNFSDVLAVILTHTRISRILAECSMPEAGGANKSDRLYYAFMEKQRIDNCGNNIAAFIMRVITPKLYDDELSFEKDRSAINEKLKFPTPSNTGFSHFPLPIVPPYSLTFNI